MLLYVECLFFRCGVLNVKQTIKYSGFLICIIQKQREKCNTNLEKARKMRNVYKNSGETWAEDTK